MLRRGLLRASAFAHKTAGRAFSSTAVFAAPRAYHRLVVFGLLAAVPLGLGVASTLYALGPRRAELEAPDISSDTLSIMEGNGEEGAAAAKELSVWEKVRFCGRFWGRCCDLLSNMYTRFYSLIFS